MNTTGGYTDEAAIETHDLIHDAELEEQRVCRINFYYFYRWKCH